MKDNFLGYGQVKSVFFKGVGPGGADIYEVEFENAKIEWHIFMGEGAKVEGLSFRKLPD